MPKAPPTSGQTTLMRCSGMSKCTAKGRSRLAASSQLFVSDRLPRGPPWKPFTDRRFERSGRQRHNSFDLEQGARYHQRRHANRGAGRRRCHVEIAIGQFAKRTDVLANFDDATIDLNDVLGTIANGAECSLQVLECLSRLRAEVTRSADEFAAGVEAKLAGNMCDTAGPGHLDPFCLS